MSDGRESNQDDWQRVTNALWFLGIGVFVQVLSHLASAYHFYKLRSASVSEAYPVVLDAIPWVDIFASAVFIYGGVLLARARVGQGLRFLATVSVLLFGLLHGALSASTVEVALFKDWTINEFIFGGTLRYFYTAFYVTAWTCLLASLLVLSKRVTRAGAPLVGIAGLMLAGETGLRIYQWVEGPIARDSFWGYQMITLLPWLVLYICVLALFVMLRGAFRKAHDSSAQSLWSSSVKGLNFYAASLSWRIGLVVSAYVLLGLALLGRSMGIAKFVGWYLPTVGFVTGLCMLVGLMGFAKQPESSPAKPTAILAVCAFLVALGLESRSLTIIIDVMNPDENSYGFGHRKDLERAQVLSTWAMRSGFAGLLLILASLRSVAHHLGQSELAARCFRTGLGLLAGAGVVWGMQSSISDLRSIGSLIFLAIIVLGVVIVVLRNYIRLLWAVSEAIMAPQELPRAEAKLDP